MLSLHSSDILAIIALALSLALTFIEVRRRLHGLHIQITDERVICIQGNTVYLLVGLSIVNPSTMPKIIYQIDFQPLENYQICGVPGEQNFEQSVVTFAPLGSSGAVAKIRLDDTASFPLDVESLHSKTVYLGLAISPSISTTVCGVKATRLEDIRVFTVL